MGKKEWLTLPQFAKRIKVKPNAVIYAVNKGRLSYQTKGRVRVVNLERAKKQWHENINEVASKKGKKRVVGKDGGSVVEPGFKAVSKFQGLTTADAERREKVYKAKMAELKYLAQAGKLIEVDKVQLLAFEVGKKVKDAIMSIAPRMAHEIAAETEPHQVELMLTKEFSKALEHLTEKELKS